MLSWRIFLTEQRVSVTYTEDHTQSERCKSSLNRPCTTLATEFCTDCNILNLDVGGVMNKRVGVVDA